MSLLQLLINPFDPTVSLGTGEDLLLGLFKLMLIIGGVLYLAFALIVVRQVHIMRSTLITKFSPLVQLFSFLHLGLAAVVLAVYFFTL